MDTGNRISEAAKPPAASAPRGRRPVVIALMLTMALAALDTTVIATAIPQIVGDLGGFAYFSWLFSGYLLAVTVTLPVYGKLSDTFGRKPVLICGISLFLAGSLLCATAWNMGALIAFRVIQGLGGGAIQGTVQTIAADLYPLKERPRIQAALSSVWASAAVAGPAVGGLIAHYVGWRLIFVTNLPIALLALWLIVRNLREPTADRATHAPGRRVDWPGALAIFATGATLITALVQGGVAWPWLSPPSLALLATSAALLALTLWLERRAPQPIIPGWVWRRRTIAAVNLAMGALGLLMIAPVVFLPTYAQSVLDLSPVAAGFVLSVMTLSWPLSAALSQHVYRRIGFRQSGMVGMAAACVVLAAFPMLPLVTGGQPSAWHAALTSLLLGGALGLFQLPLLIGVQSSVDWTERGTATASVLFSRQVGQSLGAALFGAIANATLASRLTDAPADVPRDLDGVSRALDGTALSGAAVEYVRDALAAAVHSIYFGAAAAAALAVAALLIAPRHFPVRDQSDDARADEGQESGKQAQRERGEGGQRAGT